MNTRASLLARSSLVLTGITLTLASACGSDTSTKVEAASGSGGATNSGGRGGASGASGATAKGGGSGHAGELGSVAGENAGGAAGESGAAGANVSGGSGGSSGSGVSGGSGGSNTSAGGAVETGGVGGESGSANAGTAGATSEPTCATGSECAAGSACVEAACVPVAAELTGLRWQLPCTAAHGSVNCPCAAGDSHTAALTGATGASYNVTLHFRGIVEQKTYSGGTAGNATGTSNANLFISGGTPAGDTWNIYELQVSSPAQTFYLNAGASGADQTWLIDYRATVVMAAGATVTLTANSVESVETFNRDSTGAPVIVPGVPPDPAAYDGQFVQVDVESVQAI